MDEILALNDKDLWGLRLDIVLNSLYTQDYINTYNIEPRVAQDFFDGYYEFLWDECETKEFSAVLKTDSAEMLKRYRYMF